MKTATVTTPVTNALNELYSEYLNSPIIVTGLDALTPIQAQAKNTKQNAKQTVFVCIEPQLSQYFKSIIKNLKGCCEVSFQLPNNPAFNLNEATLKNYASFLALELQPFLQKQAKRLVNMVLVGQQFSAILASYTASIHNYQIAAALSIAGSYYWKPTNEQKWEWLTNWFIDKGNCVSHLYLMSSLNETLEPPREIPTSRMANQNLYNVLRAKGCNVMLSEFNGISPSHEFLEDLQQSCQWLIDQLDESL